VASTCGLKFTDFGVVQTGSRLSDSAIEMRIPQENREECLKSAKTFKFSLPIPMVTISTVTRCEPRLDNEVPELKGVKT